MVCRQLKLCTLNEEEEKHTHTRDKQQQISSRRVEY